MGQHKLKNKKQKSVNSAPNKKRVITKATYSAQIKRRAFIFNRSARVIECREIDEADWEQAAMQVLNEYDGAWRRLADL